jgi:hypothetical protein
MLPALLCLLLAQSPAPSPPARAGDAPRLNLPQGQRVRVNSNGILLTGEVLGQGQGALWLVREDELLAAVPLQSLLQVEVRESRALEGAAKGGLIGGFTFGLIGVFLCGVGGDTSNVSVACPVVSMLAASALGAAAGGLAGALSPAWRPVYTRPGSGLPEQAR